MGIMLSNCSRMQDCKSWLYSMGPFNLFGLQVLVLLILTHRVILFTGEMKGFVVKNIFFMSVLALGFAGCGTTSKKLVDLPPLDKNAAVQVFYSEPNLKYKKVCEITATGNNSIGSSYTEKEDFANMFMSEARKCGADGVIFSFMSGTRNGNVTAYGTGIKITGQSAGLSDENKVKAFSLAIQSHDYLKVKEILTNVPKKSGDRAPTDDELVNVGLYIATLDGMNCDKEIVNLLSNEYGAYVPKFKAFNFNSFSKPDSNAPLCNDVMARSFAKMKDPSNAIVEINNHYVNLLGNPYDAKLGAKAARYSKLLTTAAQAIAASCKVSSVDPICAIKGSYLDFANKTKNAKLSALKKNANSVLAILE